MPKRMIDADKMWESNKLARCRPESIPEYPWLYGVADSYGNFQLDNTSLMVMYRRCYAIRPTVSYQQFISFIEDFHENGLLFCWSENGSRYGHWTGSELPGRLPEINKRDRFAHIRVQRHWKQLVNADPEVAAYIDACTHGTSSQSQIDFPQRTTALLPESTNLAVALPNGRVIFEGSAEELAARSQKAQESDALWPYWREFWSLYPEHRRGSESHTRDLFFSQSKEDCVNAVARLRVWMASDDWETGHVPNSETFFEEAKYRASPVSREKANGNGRTFGRVGGTAADSNERLRRIIAARQKLHGS